MIGGTLTVLGLALSIWFWYLQNRGKTKDEVSKDLIEYERKKRQRDIDSWWLRRP